MDCIPFLYNVKIYFFFMIKQKRQDTMRKLRPEAFGKATPPLLIALFSKL